MRSNKVANWVVAFVILGIIASVLLFATGYQGKTNVQLGGQMLRARVADTDAERAQGLSGTSELRKGEAMLFIFDSSGKWPFWMKDMHYSIDIIWLNEQKKVVDITANVAPSSFPKNFTPKEPARYVIEVPAGFAQQHNIRIGSQAQLDP